VGQLDQHEQATGALDERAYGAGIALSLDQESIKNCGRSGRQRQGVGSAVVGHAWKPALEE
jgi:hypothetical protein